MGCCCEPQNGRFICAVLARAETTNFRWVQGILGSCSLGGVSVWAFISCGYATMMVCVQVFVVAFCSHVQLVGSAVPVGVCFSVVYGGGECATPDQIRPEFRAKTKTPIHMFCQIPKEIGWCCESQNGRFT
jgi:hypothetical protein